MRLAAPSMFSGNAAVFIFIRSISFISTSRRGRKRVAKHFHGILNLSPASSRSFAFAGTTQESVFVVFFFSKFFIFECCNTSGEKHQSKNAKEKKLVHMKCLRNTIFSCCTSSVYVIVSFYDAYNFIIWLIHHDFLKPYISIYYFCLVSLKKQFKCIWTKKYTLQQ